jgi:hypothetical protein
MQPYDPVADPPRVRTALLLAAGLGSRLAPLTDSVPKCLVSMSGVSILERLVWPRRFETTLRWMPASVARPFGLEQIRAAAS